MSYRAPAPSSVPIVVVAFGGYVYGLDPSTGAIAWQHEDGSALTRILVTDTHVFAQGFKLTCIGYPQGQLLWQVDSPTFVASFILDGERLFVGSAGEVACHSSVDGRQLWKNEFKGKGQGEVAVGIPFNVMQLDHGR